MTHTGTLFIISAASGVGKTSLIKSVIKKINNIELSISYTTRDKRPNGEFLESAQVFDNYYATSKKFVQDVLSSGKDIILEIDWQGAMQIKNQIANWKINNRSNPIQCINIFILPPSLKVLTERLVGRGQDKPEVIQKRVDAAQREIQHYINYDYIIINDNFNHAAEELTAIINVQRLTLVRQQVVHASLINSLLV